MIYFIAVEAETVQIWTDQHYAGQQGGDAWANNCLLPYAIYPVLYSKRGDRNHEGLWICGKHELAVSGEGIISEVDALEGVCRKTRYGAVAWKLLLFRALSGATTNLLPTIRNKQTFHPSDPEAVIAWTRCIAFLGYSKDICKIYREMPQAEITSEIALSIMKHNWSPTWSWNDGAVLCLSNGRSRGEVRNRQSWHSLDWCHLNDQEV